MKSYVLLILASTAVAYAASRDRIYLFNRRPNLRTYGKTWYLQASLYYCGCHPKGEVMNRALAKSGAVMLMGIVLLSNQGCNTKGLKSESEGERGSGSVGTKLPPISGENSSGDTKLPAIPGESSSGDTKLPTISGERSSGELSGFSRNPSEERLAQGGIRSADPIRRSALVNVPN